MAQQTATQWLRKEVSKLGTRSRFYHDVMGLIDEAEKKGEEQIMHAYMHGQDNEFSHLMMGKFHITGEEYFQDTYKTKECKK